MPENQDKNLVEWTFWNSWGKLESKKGNNGKASITTESSHQDDKEYAARVAKLQAEASRKENLKLLVAVVVGILAVCLIVYLLGLIDIKPEESTPVVDSNSEQTAGQPKEETPEEIEAAIQEELKKGGFSSKEAYFSAELTKQSHDVGKTLTEFSKKMKSISPKMNITSLVIASKMERLSKDKTINGFGIEIIGPRDGESDEVKLVSHLKGKTSPVEFFAEGGRVVAHFKDYPASYCKETKGAAVCGN
jgi:hypothetical protein